MDLDDKCDQCNLVYWLSIITLDNIQHFKVSALETERSCHVQ